MGNKKPQNISNQKVLLKTYFRGAVWSAAGKEFIRQNLFDIRHTIQ
jgi:hypothetical protein